MREDNENGQLLTLRREDGERLRVARSHDAPPTEAAQWEPASLVNLTHDSIFVRDMNGVIRYWNRAAEELYGWTAEQALGSGAQELLQTVFPTSLDLVEGEVLRAGRWEGELVHTKKDGGQVFVASRWSLQRDENGAPIAILSTNNNITERKRAEQARQEGETALRDVTEIIPAMAWTTLRDGSNASVNRRWMEYTGLSAEDSAGSGWQRAVHPDDVERHVRKWRASVASGEPFEDEARLRRDADGEYRWFLVRSVPLRDEQGDILKWYAILTDIEDRKRAEALLAGEARILEMVANGDTLSHILDSLCRLVEEHTRDALCSVLLVEDGRLRHVGKPSLPAAYVEAVDAVITVQPSWGSCGPAAYFARQVIVSDVMSSPLFNNFRETVMPLFPSLRAVWSSPIISSEGKVMGTFAMYYREPRSPSQHDQEIIAQITHLAGVAIQRKLTEEKLQRSEAYLAEAQRLAHTGSWAWNPATDELLYCSAEMFRIFGMDPQEDVPAREAFWQRIHPDDRDRVYENLLTAARQKRDYVVEHRILWPDGTLKYHQAIGHPVLDATGEIVEYLGTGIDVTERKRAEHALRDSEELKRRIIESSQDCIKVLDLNGNLLFMSSGGQELLEIDNIQHYLNACWIDFWQSEDRPKIREAIAIARAGGIGKFQAFCPSAKGAPRWWDVITTPIRNADGQTDQLLSVSRDITERKQAEEELRYHMQLLKTVTDNASSALYIVDAAGLGTFVNPSLERMTCYRAEELIGQVVHDKIHHTKPDGTPYPVAECPLTGAVLTRKTVRGEDLFVRKDGTFFPVRYTAGPVFRDGVAVETVIEVEDLTERKQAEQALHQAQTELAHVTRVMAMGELTASIAHEVSQPLSALATNANACLRWLARQPPDLSEARETLHRIVRDCSRAGEVITRIRSLVRKSSAVKVRLDLNEAIEEVLAIIEPEARRHAVPVRTELAASLPPVQGDRVQLQQVILNLVINGIEATKEVVDRSRELRIRSRPHEAGTVLVTVQDNGIGLKPESLERLFEAFYTTKAEGMGIGLSISRSIIEAHGGRLWPSANDERGATFQFTLPADDAYQRAAAVLV
jgi:PAS domain S-box-containing protein